MSTYSEASDDKFGIMTTLSFQFMQMKSNIVSCMETVKLLWIGKNEKSWKQQKYLAILQI